MSFMTLVEKLEFSKSGISSVFIISYFCKTQMEGSLKENLGSNTPLIKKASKCINPAIKRPMQHEQDVTNGFPSSAPTFRRNLTHPVSNAGGFTTGVIFRERASPDWEPQTQAGSHFCPHTEQTSQRFLLVYLPQWRSAGKRVNEGSLHPVSFPPRR